MVRHVVMFNFKPGTSPEQVEAYLAEIRLLPGKIPQIRDYRTGYDLGVNPGNYQMVVTGDFDTVEDYLAYRDHPEHQRVVRELGLPIIEQRAAVQFDC